MKYRRFVATLVFSSLLAMPTAATVFAQSRPHVGSFTLINADTDQPLPGFNPLQEGAVVDVAKLPTRRLSIRANTSPAIVGSVRFGLNSNANYRVENVAPYSLQGDINGNYSAWIPALGSYVVSATAYSGPNAGGVAGPSLVQHVSFIDGSQSLSDGSQSLSLAVTSLTLLDASTGRPVSGFDPLPEGAVLDPRTLPSAVAVRANTSPPRVGSVRFGYNGNLSYRTENVGPYALHGDTNGTYNPWTPKPGAYEVIATPFSGTQASGSKGVPLLRRFTVLAPTATSSPSDPAPVTDSAPVTAAPIDSCQRVAVSHDGNMHDLDDIVAGAMTVAILSRAGAASKVVWFGHSDHTWWTDSAREEQMRVTTVETAVRFGGFNTSRFFNLVTQGATAQRTLVSEINASSDTNRLCILLAGQMEFAGQAIQAADPAKRPFVTIVSHSLDNESHAWGVKRTLSEPGASTIHGWYFGEIVALGVDGIHIADGNPLLATLFGPWTWLRDSSDANLRWIWCRYLGTPCPEFPGFAVGAGQALFDVSDATEAYWLVTGDEQGDPEKVRALLTGGQ